MKHITEGFDRICGTPVPEQGGYMTDAEWRKMPECPVCFAKYQPTLHKHAPKVKEQNAPPIKKRQGLYLRQFVK